MVLNHFNRFGLRGLKFLFTRLYGKAKLLILDYPQFKAPIYLRNQTSDIPTFYQCIFNEDYNINFDFEPKVIFDLGSNIGLSVFYFKSKYPDAKVICVEPEEGNFDLLLKNTKSFEDVHCFQAGVWHRDAKLKIEDEEVNSWCFTVKESEDNRGLSAVTIDGLMQSCNVDYIDVLKIDIEGSEKYLFSENYENWLPKVKVIIIELHDKFMPGCAKSFFNAIQEYDFALMQKGENIICFMDKLLRPPKIKELIF